MGNPCGNCERKITSVSFEVVGDKVRLTTQPATLAMETKYCLIVAQPCPEAGKNLPVEIVVGDCAPIPLQMFGPANIEFGQDLPGCRCRVPLFYNNAGQFIDLRGHECWHYCR